MDWKTWLRGRGKKKSPPSNVPNRRFRDKLKNVKMAIKGWSREKFGNLEQEINRARKTYNQMEMAADSSRGVEQDIGWKRQKNGWNSRKKEWGWKGKTIWTTNLNT